MMDSPLATQPQKITAGDIKNILNLFDIYRLLTDTTFDVVEDLNALYFSLPITTALYPLHHAEDPGQVIGKSIIDDEYILDAGESQKLSKALGFIHLTEENNVWQAFNNLKDQPYSILIDFICSNYVNKLDKDVLNIICRFPQYVENSNPLNKLSQDILEIISQSGDVEICIDIISKCPHVIIPLSILYNSSILDALDLMKDLIVRAQYHTFSAQHHTFRAQYHTFRAQHHTSRAQHLVDKSKNLVRVLSSLYEANIKNAHDYLLIYDNIEHLDFLFSGTNLNTKGLLNIFKNAERLQDFITVFSILKDLQIDNTDISSAIWKNSKYVKILSVLISEFKDTIKNREFYQNLCENINHIELMFRCFSLMEPDLSDKKPFYSLILICCNNAKHIKKIEQIASIFSRLSANPECLDLSQNTLCEDVNNIILSLFDFEADEKNLIIHKIFILACHHGHSDIVKFLLGDTRIDLVANNNERIFQAFNSSHKEIVISLLDDTRLNPATKYKEIVLLHLSEINKGRSFNLASVLFALSDLEKQGLLTEISATAICKYSANSSQIPAALLRFHKMGYLYDDLINPICEHVESYEEFAQLFECLHPSKMLLFRNNCNALFKKDSAIYLHPLFELMIKAGLFESPKNYLETDNRQHIFDIMLNLNIMFKFKGVTENLRSQFRVLFLCLHDAKLLVQPIIREISGIEPYIKPVIKVLKFFNRHEKLDETNCQLILKNARHAFQLKDALFSLDYKWNGDVQLLNEIMGEIMSALCKHPEFSEKMVFLFLILNQNNIVLDSGIIDLICQNAAYAASLYSACFILGDQIKNNEHFISLFQDPKKAIQSALKIRNFSINHAAKIDESGVQDFVKIQEASLKMNIAGGGSLVGQSPLQCPPVKDLEKFTFFAFLPKEILHNIASLSGTNTLEQNTRNELINSNLNPKPPLSSK